MVTDEDTRLNEYAPGVEFGGDSHWFNRTDYSGTAPALVDCGLIHQEWLPGVGSNGKTSQLVIFMPDGVAKLMPRNSRRKTCDTGHGAITIRKSGSIFHVLRYWSEEEKLRKMAEKKDAEEREKWLAAKEVAAQPDFPNRWKEGVIHHIDTAEKLIDGRLVFTNFPDIGLAENEIKSAKRIIAELKALLLLASPAIKNKVQIASNVYSLNGAAFKNMPKS